MVTNYSTRESSRPFHVSRAFHQHKTDVKNTKCLCENVFSHLTIKLHDRSFGMSGIVFIQGRRASRVRLDMKTLSTCSALTDFSSLSLGSIEISIPTEMSINYLTYVF